MLLDLDGTLIDPRPGIVGSVRYALGRLGAPVPPAEELTWCIGPSLRETFPQLLGSAAQVEEAVRLYREHYRGGAMYDAVLYRGIETMLEELATAGFRLVVVTAKPHAFARPIVAHFGLARHMAAVHGPGLDGTHDDKGELLAAVLAEEGIEPARAVMVGDRKFDALAARRNGVNAIGALWGYGSAEELRAAGASVLCAQPADVPAAVRRLIAANSVSSLTRAGRR